MIFVLELTEEKSPHPLSPILDTVEWKAVLSHGNFKGVATAREMEWAIRRAYQAILLSAGVATFK